MYVQKTKWRISKSVCRVLLGLNRFLVMDKPEELYSLVFSSSCFKEAYQKRIFDTLGDLNPHQSQSTIDIDLDNSLLVMLTVIQKLFQGLKTVHCPYLRSIADDIVEEKLLVDKLLDCLGHRNQHVVFSASKAIVIVLQMRSEQMIKVKWFDSLINFICFGKESEHPWRKLYIMELIRKVLQDSRNTVNQKIEDENFQQVENQACCREHGQDVVYSCIPGSKLAKLFLRHFNFQHILFAFIPFVTRPNGLYSFMKSYHHVGALEDFATLQACLRFEKAIHDQEKVKKDPISGIKECNLIAFLNCLVEIAKCLHSKSLLSSLHPESTENHYSMVTESGDESIGKTQPEDGNHLQITSTTTQLGTIVSTLIQYLHYPRLSSVIFKKILEVLNQVIMIPSSTLSNQKGGCTDFTKMIRTASVSYLSVVECCLLDKVPKCLGRTGFCGTEINSSGPSITLDTQRECIDLVALRKAGLILIKSAYIVLKMAQNQEGSLVFQRLSLSCVSLWSTHLPSVAPNMLPLNDTKQNCNHHEFHSLLVSLFVDQDDELVEILLLLLFLYQETQRNVPSSEISASISRQLNPHWLFTAFMESIDFDQSLLLDLLISSETRFLEYLLQYLHFVISDWKAFIQCLESYKGNFIYREVQATGENFISLDQKQLESVFGLSNDQVAEENRQSFYRKQNKPAAEDGVVLKNKQLSVSGESSLNTDINGSFISSQKPGRKRGASRGHVSDAVYSSEISNQPICGVPKKKNQRKVGEIIGLKSIAMAYSSSDESDVEVEDNGEDAGSPIQVNAFNKNTSASCLHSQTTTSLSLDDGNLSVGTFDSQPERENTPTSTVLLSENLDKIMTMLIRLRITITRLSKTGYFPYCASPLLALMETVEKTYDGC